MGDEACNEISRGARSAFKIVLATTRTDIARARVLIEEYVAWLGIDLNFQSYAEELARFPGQYAAPRGGLWLMLRCDGPISAVGCIALRELSADTAEIKRLFVKPQFRGRGIGQDLAEHAIKCARRIGYEFLVLDTLTGKMQAAGRLYENLGFQEIAPYYHNPLPDAKYYRLALRRMSRGR